MNMFRECPLDKVSVVLIGQDPYIRPGQAQGLSFSVPTGLTVPPSLRKMYECLIHWGLITAAPAHGNLVGWARQGVLMLNCALTTVMGVSNAHAAVWADYTSALIRELMMGPPRVFILLGAFAQGKVSIDTTGRSIHTVLTWGHPSPLNSANKTDNPNNFKYCDVFTRTNDALIARGVAPINWNPDGDAMCIVNVPTIVSPPVTVPSISPVSAPPVSAPPSARELALDDPPPTTTDTLWVFTDGGSKGNGKLNCNASWGFYVTDGCSCADARGLVDELVIPGKVYKSSNNRGELTAIYNALQYVVSNQAAYSFDRILIVSDSEYSIKCLDLWSPKWFADPVLHNLAEKMNVDIIRPARAILEQLREARPVTFRHVRSHKAAPADTESADWFIWKCNDIVDKLCNIALGRPVKK
jgi:uracil-DNA glycosylase